MRYGIFSDIHANLEALQAVIAALQREHIDVYLCPGDLVGYGANPEECIEVVQGLKAMSVAGNHDWAVLGQTNLEYFNPIAKAAVLWTQSHLSSKATQFLKDLPLVSQNEEVMMVHAALPHPEEFDYLMDMRGAEQMFSFLQRNVCFIGHTHIPFIVKKEQGRIITEETFRTKIDPDCQYIVNVGSVGQPRDGNPRAAYCIFDSKFNTLVIERVDYDIQHAQTKIIEAGLPEQLAARLSFGK